MISAMADCDPPHPVIFLPGRRQAGAVHHVRRYLRPLLIRQQPVLGSGAQRAMPHRPGQPARAERVMRLVQQPGQAAKVPAAIGPQRRLQLGRVPPPGDQVRVAVLLAPARPIQVVQQPGDPLPARDADLPDQPGPPPRPRLSG